VCGRIQAVQCIHQWRDSVRAFEELYHLEVAMWSKPEYTEMRFGFEVTMYIANR
jgi:coenzyme PQQ precursor peptide PqqA